MNKYRFVTSGLAVLWLLAAPVASWSAEEATTVKISEVPSAVQKTIHTQVGKGKLETIEKTVDDGETTYDVQMRKANRQRSFTVGEDGTLLDMEVFPNETPTAVHATIKQQVGTGEIESITKEFDDGEVTYEVETSRGGKECIFVVDENGKLLKAQVLLAETPAAVQKTIQKELGGGALGDIIKVMDDDGTTYETEFNPDGASRIVAIDDKGVVISDEEDIPLAKAPDAVQTTIKGLAKDGQIGSVTKTTEDGEVTYDVDVKHGDKTESVTIGADGKVVL